MATDTDAMSSLVPAASATETQAICAHCGLPVPAGLVEPDAERQFCCQGCRAVYEFIHGCALERFYSLRDSASGGIPGRATNRSYQSFDDPAFIERHCHPVAGGLLTTEFYLEGVHCSACVWLTEKLPRVVEGVVDSRLDMNRALLRISWDPRRVALSQAAAALDHLGYPPHPARDAQARRIRREEDHRFLVRIAVAAAAAGNVMMMAFALYGGAFSGIEAHYAAMFRWVSMFLGLISLIWPGSIFFRGAWAALRTRTAHLDVPIALGLAIGGLAGTVNTFLGRGEIYFDSLTMLVFLLLVGRWLQLRQQRWTADSVGLLYSLTPSSARRVEGSETREVPVETLVRTDLIEVLAGETIPADGTIETGISAMDASWLTGESQPVNVQVGDVVLAGTVNLAAPIRVRISAAGVETRAARLMRLVEEGTRNPAPIVRLADRIAGWFTVVVIVLAAAVFAAWLRIDPTRAPDIAAALLIVCCPCALGLATPLAFTVAIGRAAQQGILIKSGESIEALARNGVLYIDKTGTVTEGKIALVCWHGDTAIRPVVAELERHSSHPVARALVSGIDAADSTVAVTKPLLEHSTPEGLVGTIEGRTIIVGSPAFVRSRNALVSTLIAESEREVVARGLTPVLIAADGHVTAVAGLGDRIREDSASAVRAFHDLGWNVRLLSGDHPDVVTSVAASLGLQSSAVLGGVTPEDKLAEIRRAVQLGPVVMVGDGVNDAAALSAATVGIAVHGGAEASLAAAGIYLTRPGLSPIIDLLRAARGTVRAIRSSFAASLGYNLVALALAATGVITPLIAAILMPISSLTVAALVMGRPTFGAPSCR